VFTFVDQECSGGRWGFIPAPETIRREPETPKGSGICGICGTRLRLDYHGAIPRHQTSRMETREVAPLELNALSSRQ
jgi:hypothetical protein